jgi:hypothetical protein
MSIVPLLHCSSLAPSGAKCDLLFYISLLTELEHSGHLLIYKHLAPNGAKTLPYVQLTLIKKWMSASRKK